jgi:hypothetical protein
MNTDQFLLKRFNREKYNCWDFARDVWREATGQDLFTTVPPCVDSILPTREEISSPVSPCLVLMLRKRLTPHVGVYYKGRILHMNERGPEFSEPSHATAPYPTVKYYK